MRRRTEYFIWHALYLSLLNPATFERQAVINKIYLGIIIVLVVMMARLFFQFNALDAEIAVRRATSNAIVTEWKSRLAQDSLQRIAWEVAKVQQLGAEVARQNDSILNQIRSKK